MSSIDYDEPPYGYALRRNGSCLSNEQPCGTTWSTSTLSTHVCCPHGTKCPKGDSVKTSVCCKSESDCTPLFTKPHCADEYGVLYLSEDYFCCSNKTTAFTFTSGGRNGWVGCVDDVSDAGADTKLIQANSTVTGSVSSISSTALQTSTGTSTGTSTTDSTTSATSTSESSNSESSSSSTNTGAIAGGVVGGVAGFAIILALIWFFIRRNRNKQKQDSYPPLQHIPSPPMSSNQGASETTESQFGELHGRSRQIVELPAHQNERY